MSFPFFPFSVLSVGRNFLAILAVVVLALATIPNWGSYYSRPGIFLILAALVLALAACSWPERRGRPAPKRMQGVVFAVAALLLSGLGVAVADVLYPKVALALKAVQVASWIGFFLTLSLLIHLGTSMPLLGVLRVQVLLLFLSGTVLRLSAVVASPQPRIDVYVALRDAPGHLLQGHNPYTAPYPWPYDSPPAEYDAYPFYPPLPFLVALPFRAAGVDVRYANVLCDLVAAGVLLLAGWSRGNLLVGALAAGAYLHFPRVPFMMEQAWYEPMVAATLGSGLLLVERGRRLGYFLIGLGLTGKQYGVVLLWPLLKALRPHWRATLLGVVLAGAAVLLPFFLWDPHAFVDVVVRMHLKRPLVDDSLTLHAGAKDLLGVSLPKPFLWGTALVLIGWITWRTPAKGTGSALWIGTALLVFCLCHSQGFFNYYYLCEYLMLLGIAGLVAEKGELQIANCKLQIANCHQDTKFCP